MNNMNNMNSGKPEAATNMQQQNGNKNGAKNKLNIIGKGYVKPNSVGGEIISFIPDVPIMAYLDDLLFIATVPNEDQKYAPAYCRLQDKSRMAPEARVADVIKEFKGVNSVGYIKEKKGQIIVCAPRVHVEVDLRKLVAIFTIPEEGRDYAPVYFKDKTYNKNKAELSQQELIVDNAERVDGVVLED